MRPSAAAVAFAWDTVSRFGECVPGAGNDHVRVRLSQQGLARHNQCAPSTVSWYLRQLGPVIVSRRGGLVLDRGELSELGLDSRPLAPRTVAVERELVDAFARPTADGTRVELVNGEDGHRASLQDLATHLGINRSSAHRHVTALEAAGRLQRRGHRLYLVDGHATTTKESPMDNQPPPAVAGGSPVTGSVTPEQVLRLLDKLSDLLGTVAAIASQLVSASQSANEGAQDPRIFGAQAADGDELRAGSVADRARGSSPDVDLIDRSDVQITSNPSPLRAAESRDPDEVRAENPRITDPCDWGPADLPQLLAPLLTECDRRELPGVSDAQRVIASLRPYAADQVAAAARQMTADLRSGAPMRSPVAILIRKADQGDPYYFRSAAEPEPPAAPLVLADDGDEVDEEAEAAVLALDAHALDQLDEAVRGQVRRLLGEGMATNALNSPATLAHWRPIVWRSLQHNDPSAEEHI